VGEAAERAVLVQQLVLGAALHDLTALDDDDLVRAADGREAVGDDDRRAAAQQPIERALDQYLGRPVDVRGRLIEDQDPRIGEEGTRDRDQLPLACREAGAALAHLVVEAAGDARRDAVHAHGCRRSCR
jgi:hypothetical protein